ncbi:MAG: hypothetical protein QOG49_558 [Frankiaceae bacterium]|nr:hypothetical protein [Frankiaceae bacterium]
MENGLGWVIGGTVALAGVAAMVAVGSGLAHHDSKAVDSRAAAYDATMQVDLAQVARQEQAYYAENGQYGSAQEIGAPVLPGASGTMLTVMYDDKSFCVQAAHLGTKNVYYYSSADGLLPLGQTCS